MKKFTALFLAILVILSCLSGCGDKKDDTKKEDTKKEDTKKEDTTTPSTPSTGDKTEDKKEEKPKRTEKVTITIGIKRNANVEDYETNEQTKWIEEMCNVDLEFFYFPADTSAAQQQLNLMLAGEEKLPDILYTMGVSSTMAQEMGEDGYLVDLAPYFADPELTPYWHEAVKDMTYPEDAKKMIENGTDPETDRMWGAPSYQCASGADHITNHIYINTKWLEAVGEDMPTTPDELYTVLTKFKTMDPNGNGLADEMPMVGSHTLVRADTAEFVINAYIYCNDNYFWTRDAQGNLTQPYTTDEYREALKMLNKMYKEGLLSPQFFTLKTTTEMKEIWTPSSGTAIAGISAGHIQNCYNANSELVFDYAYVPALDAGTGKGGYRGQNTRTFAYSNYVTTDCEYPEVAVEVLDLLYSVEGFLRMRYGVPEVDWVYAEEGQKNMFGEQAYINVLDGTILSGQNNHSWHLLTGTVADYRKYTMYAPTEGEDYTTRNTIWRNNFISTGLANETAPNLQFTIYFPSSLTEEVTELGTAVKGYVQEARALFISGDMDPNSDADWNAYLKELEECGLSDYFELAKQYA